MCGIAGYFHPNTARADTSLADRMLQSIAHRGPDDQGLMFLDVDSGKAYDCATPYSAMEMREKLPSVHGAQGFSHQLSFAHCRYSIVDLSPGGHQPMWDGSRRLCVSFNGEIYNYVELRDELQRAGYRFQSRSDTEVILAGYIHWGVGLFERMNGPWALSLYDTQARRLLLSRDRLGKAPLYFTRKDGAFCWASEIKALLSAFGPDRFRVRAQAVDDYVTEGWRDRDGTFWEGIEDFPPASYAWVENDGTLDVRRYWTLPDRSSREAPPEAAAAEKLRDLLVDAIRIRARADVPVAFELSGGMDSSSLVALAASELSDRVTTYTVEYDDPRVNEAPYARAVAARFGAKIDYRVIRPAHSDFWRDADEFVRLEEEPFHAPNLHTNQQLRRRMKADGARVVIGGAAGDEVLAGYAGEYLGPYLLHLLSRGNLAGFVREAGTNTEYRTGLRSAAELGMSTLFPEAWNGMLKARSGEARFMRECYVSPDQPGRRGHRPVSFSARMRDNMGRGKMNYWLRSANKANFGIPIEPRAPFLDFRVVDFVFSLPPEYLIRNGWHKWLLRQALARHLPEEVLWRRNKVGFPFPIVDWLIASRGYVEANLGDRTCPYIAFDGLMRRYEAFARTAPYTLWRLVSLGLWWRRVVEGRTISGVT